MQRIDTNGILCAKEELGVYNVNNEMAILHTLNSRSSRPVAASFGFAFEFGAPSSSEPVAVEEPPSKRRKTAIHDTDGVPIVGQVEVTPARRPEQTTGGDRTIIASRKPAKSRRRLPADAVEDVAEDAAKTASNVGGDDSFIIQAKSKRKPTRRTKVAQEGAIEVEDADAPLPQPTKTRPGRRAAITATMKVTEGFAEEAAPVDKKRREPAPVTATRRARKKQAVVEGEQVETEAQLVTEEVPAEEIKPEVDALPVTPPRTLAATTKGRKPRACRRKAAPKKATKTTRALEVIREGQRASTGDIEMQSPKSVRCDPGFVTEVKPMAISPTRTSSTPRRPLVETDVNAFRPSMSPEKFDKECKTATKRKRPAARSKNVLEAEAKGRDENVRNAKGSKKRKLQVERDDTPDGNAGAESGFRMEEGLELDSTTRTPRGAAVESNLRAEETLAPSVSRSPSGATRGAGGARRRKLRVERDGVTDGEPVTQSAVQAAELPAPGSPSPLRVSTAEHSSPSAPTVQLIQPPAAKRPRMRLDPETAEPSRRETVRTVKHKTSPGLRKQLFKRATIPEESHAEDVADSTAANVEEDVDWLFAPTESRRVPASAQLLKASSKPPQKRKSFAKLVDVDLDDLVTNIATFAQVRKPDAAKAVQADSAVSEQSGVKKVTKSKRKR